MPIHRRLPKRGFTNINRVPYVVLNFNRMQSLINDNKIDPKKIINYQTLFDLGIVKTLRSKIKLLAKGEIKTKINIEVASASTSAADIVDKLGGSITILENNKPVKTTPKKSGV